MVILIVFRLSDVGPFFRVCNSVDYKYGEPVCCLVSACFCGEISSNTNSEHGQRLPRAAESKKPASLLS